MKILYLEVERKEPTRLEIDPQLFWGYSRISANVTMNGMPYVWYLSTREDALLRRAYQQINPTAGLLDWIMASYYRDGKLPNGPRPFVVDVWVKKDEHGWRITVVEPVSQGI